MVIKDAYGLLQYRAFKEWLEGRAGKVNATVQASEAVELLDGPADWAAFGLDPKNVERWRQEQLDGRNAPFSESGAPSSGDGVQVYSAESLWQTLFLTGLAERRRDPLESCKAYLVQHRLLDLFDDLTGKALCLRRFHSIMKSGFENLVIF